MEYAHKDGNDAAAEITVPGVGSVPIEDGTFEADPAADIHERLVELGHEPVGADDVAPEEDEVEIPPASAYDEQTIVEDLDYREKQEIASQYEHINGNASDDAITEALIEQRRTELEEE